MCHALRVRETFMCRALVAGALLPAHEHAGGLCRMVVKEEAVSRVKRGDFSHVFICQCEVEDVKVLFHAFHMGCLGYDDHSSLHQPAEGYLCRGLSQTLGYAAQEFVLKESVASDRKSVV